MNHKKESYKKVLYCTPDIQQIVLDNEISLSLDSQPPVGPDEMSFNAPSYFDNNIFNTNIG